MIHYWGAKAVCARLAFGSPSRLPQFIEKYGLPVFLRRHPPRMHPVYYSSEPAILAWELAMAKGYREELLAKSASKRQAAGTLRARRGRPCSSAPAKGTVAA